VDAEQRWLRVKNYRNPAFSRLNCDNHEADSTGLRLTSVVPVAEQSLSYNNYRDTQITDILSITKPHHADMHNTHQPLLYLHYHPLVSLTVHFAAFRTDNRLFPVQKVSFCLETIYLLSNVSSFASYVITKRFFCGIRLRLRQSSRYFPFRNVALTMSPFGQQIYCLLYFTYAIYTTYPVITLQPI